VTVSPAPPAPPASAIVVAIDGPAGVGKSTAARRLAARLQLPYVDTGAMYRAAALFLADRKVDPADRTAVAAEVQKMPLRLQLAGHAAQVELEGRNPGPRLRLPEVSALTSRIAVHPEVRLRLVALQQEFLRRHGGVMEGRDIGTVVVPETPFKFYLDAAPGVRAERRHAELAQQGGAPDPDEVARQLAERDARDSSRSESPLQAAPDACHGRKQRGDRYGRPWTRAEHGGLRFESRCTGCRRCTIADPEDGRHLQSVPRRPSAGGCGLRDPPGGGGGSGRGERRGEIHLDENPQRRLSQG
jgi:cytidylate kinase